MNPKSPFRIFRKVKISVSKDLVGCLINESNNTISKNDLGHIFNMILSNPKKLIETDIKDYIERKYDINRITSHLKKTNKSVIPFKGLMNKLNLSQRKFYPRLNIIKIFYSKSHKFKWNITRGKFIKKKVV
ncbi:MAG: hypothetical protein ABIC04_01940 [Nanoarchaeota archaeon]